MSRLAPGTRRTWTEPGKGSITGEVVHFVPAGTPFHKALPEGVTRFRGINMDKILSRNDRYVMRVEGEHGPYRLPQAERVEAGSEPAV